MAAPVYRLLPLRPVVALPRTKPTVAAGEYGLYATSVKLENVPAPRSLYDRISFSGRAEVIDLTDDEPASQPIQIKYESALPVLESGGDTDDSGDEYDAGDDPCETPSDDSNDSEATAEGEYGRRATYESESDEADDDERDSDAELRALDADVTEFNLGLNVLDAHLSGRSTGVSGTDSDSGSSSTSKRSTATSKSKSGSNLIHINGAATSQWKKAAKKKRRAEDSAIPSQHELEQRSRQIDAAFIILEEEQQRLELSLERKASGRICGDDAACERARLIEIADAFIELENEQDHLAEIEDKYYAESSRAEEAGAETTDAEVEEDEAMEVDEAEIARECGSSAERAWDLTSSTATVDELRKAVFAQENVWRVKLESEGALQTSSSLENQEKERSGEPRSPTPFAHYFRTLGTLHAKYGVDMSQFDRITDQLVFPRPRSETVSVPAGLVSEMSDIPPVPLASRIVSGLAVGQIRSDTAAMSVKSRGRVRRRSAESR